MANAKKEIAKQRAGIIASRRVYAQDRMADYRYTNDVITSLFDNAASTAAGGKAALTAQHGRQLSAIEGLRARTEKGTARDTGRARNFIGGNYGSAISGAVAPLLRVADRHGEGAAAAQRGIGRAGKVTARGGNTIMSIMQAGVEESRAAAQYQTAEALSYRARNDAKLIAEQQMALQTMRLQAQLDLQNQKKLLTFQKNLEEKDATGKLTGLSTVTDVSTQAAVAMREYMAENPGATVDELIQAASAGDQALAAEAGPLLRALAYNVQGSVNDSGQTLGNYSREDEAKDIQEAILSLYPDFKKGKLAATILPGLNGLWGLRNAGPEEETTEAPLFAGKSGYPAGFGSDAPATFQEGDVDASAQTVTESALRARAAQAGIPYEEMKRDLESRGWRVI